MFSVIHGIIVITEDLDRFGIGFSRFENWYIVFKVSFVMNISDQPRKSTRAEMFDSCAIKNFVVVFFESRYPSGEFSNGSGLV